jgi:serine/threonine protein kinase
MTPCFTANFVAPEVLSKQQYDVSCDIWSLGSIMYTMMVGETPFGILPNDTEDTILSKLNTGKLNLDDSKSPISADGRDLLKRMLNFDGAKRPSAQSVLEHSWIKNGDRLPVMNLHSTELKDHRDINKAISGAMNVIKGDGRTPGLQLRPPQDSGLFARRMKTKNIPGPLNLKKK